FTVFIARGVTVERVGCPPARAGGQEERSPQRGAVDGATRPSVRWGVRRRRALGPRFRPVQLRGRLRRPEVPGLIPPVDEPLEAAFDERVLCPRLAGCVRPRSERPLAELRLDG